MSITGIIFAALIVEESACSLVYSSELRDRNLQWKLMSVKEVNMMRFRAIIAAAADMQDAPDLLPRL